MKNIQNITAFIFIGAIIILTGISVLGVWNVFGGDVILKSTQTLGLLAIVSIIIIVAGKFLNHQQEGVIPVPQAPDPSFRSIRQIILTVLIISLSILAILGVLTIWDAFSDHSVLYKSLGSVAILAFSSFLIVLTCLDRENSPILHKKDVNSPGPLIVLLVLAGIYFFFSAFLF
ncbi:MAG: hypothetical protein PHG25_01385 [Candidatus Pacebacteria bacterium]|nr:hypothetical protein [Candidatus Paceibacterota bacterium]